MPALQPSSTWFSVRAKEGNINHFEMIKIGRQYKNIATNLRKLDKAKGQLRIILSSLNFVQVCLIVIQLISNLWPGCLPGQEEAHQ